MSVLKSWRSRHACSSHPCRGRGPWLRRRGWVAAREMRARWAGVCCQVSAAAVIWPAREHCSTASNTSLAPALNPRHQQSGRTRFLTPFSARSRLTLDLHAECVLALERFTQGPKRSPGPQNRPRHAPRPEASPTAGQPFEFLSPACSRRATCSSHVRHRARQSIATARLRTPARHARELSNQQELQHTSKRDHGHLRPGGRADGGRTRGHCAHAHAAQGRPSHPGYKITRIRSFCTRKVKFTQQTISERLGAIVSDFPRLDDVHRSAI